MAQYEQEEQEEQRYNIKEPTGKFYFKLMLGSNAFGFTENQCEAKIFNKSQVEDFLTHITQCDSRYQKLDYIIQEIIHYGTNKNQ